MGRKVSSSSSGALLNRRLRAIDLFCGCGGLSLGVKQAGFRIVGAVDNDSLAMATYRANHRGVQTWEQDIRTIDAATMRNALGLEPGELDLLAGCPPCQGFSSLRTLRGKRRVSDFRNELIFEFLRFVREFRPKAIMVENVPGLAQDIRLQRFMRSLRGMGYSCRVRILDAADYLVPQRRHRMVLLAGLGGPVPFGRPSRRKVTVREAIESMPYPRISNDPLHRSRPNHSDAITNLIKQIPKNGGSRRDLDEDMQLECHRKCYGFLDVYGRMAWDDVSPTITGGCINPSKGRFLHPSQNRVISLREAALLQAFPPRYNFPMNAGRYPVARMIGNALPPAFVRRQGHAIRRYVYNLRTKKDSPRANVTAFETCEGVGD